ncbi:KAP family P-loop NTPase fold protein [Desulfovibrio cuneatus]|uniref:KAP family P-loop NTPase fold protein n=1 Tax=Desulfovibrio cuneatus TaxID=159728 RepID=UPI00041B614C|nr:P-loop NTPase fold protein [Desulfovibrio cuneatus]
MSDTPDNSNKLVRFDTSNIKEKSDPWADNLVPDREILAKTLTQKFQTSGGPYVLSISSGWGTGKSDFLERWQHWLHNEPGKPQGLCFRFNAWEYDYTQDPFLAFATALQAFIKENPTTLAAELKAKAKTLFGLLAKVGIRKGMPILRRLASAMANTAAQQQGADETTAEFFGTVTDESLKAFEEKAEEWLAEDKINREAIKIAMQKFGEAVQEAYKMPLIIMVDELDRCKPSFAVAVLETIKHLFCVKNTVFVLAIEPTQIANCIAKTYGLNRAGARAYLHKFIDMDIHLPAIDKHSFICQKFEEPQFTLGIDQKIDDELATYSLYLPGWIAAITYEILPSCREALQVMNQVSVLSHRKDMDFVSLLACARAMSYRAEKNCSISQAVENALIPDSYSPLNPSQHFFPSNANLQYNNIFSALIQGKNSSGQSSLRDTFLELHTTTQANNSCLMRNGKSFCLLIINTEQSRLNERPEYQWIANNKYGTLWRKQLEEFINFVEPSKEEGPPQ